MVVTMGLRKGGWVTPNPKYHSNVPDTWIYLAVYARMDSRFLIVVLHSITLSFATIPDIFYIRNNLTSKIEANTPKN